MGRYHVDREKRSAVVTAGLFLALSLVVGACAAPPEEWPRPPAKTVERPYFADQRLRPVRMASGRALGYVQRETASQVLCQLLDKEEWEGLLDGEIGRKPLSAPYSGCHIATERGMVAMEFLARDDPFTPDTTIAGRPSTVVTQETGTAFVVALADDALAPAPRQDYPVRRLLELKLVGEQRDIGTRVLEKIVPLRVKDGEPLPEVDAEGHVRDPGAPVDARDFVDLPMPVQALALCAILRQQVPDAEEFEASDTGRCRAFAGERTAVLKAEHVRYPAEYPEQVAGRPASVMLDPPVVTVLLRDGAEVQLYVSGQDSVALAEKVVPSLVG